MLALGASFGGTSGVGVDLVRDQAAGVWLSRAHRSRPVNRWTSAPIKDTRQG